MSAHAVPAMSRSGTRTSSAQRTLTESARSLNDKGAFADSHSFRIFTMASRKSIQTSHIFPPPSTRTQRTISVSQRETPGTRITILTQSDFSINSTSGTIGSKKVALTVSQSSLESTQSTTSRFRPRRLSCIHASSLHAQKRYIFWAWSAIQTS